MVGQCLMILRPPSPLIHHRNHVGTTDHSGVIVAYLDKELKCGAMLGPFDVIPFDKPVGVSPMNMRLKKNGVDRRVIVDLSFPWEGISVNHGIEKDYYYGLPVLVQYPTTDTLAQRVHLVGRGSHIFKRDLA